MEILSINFNDSLYLKSLELREKILRKPLGLTVTREQLENEKLENYFHYCIIENTELVSALTMKINRTSIQTCQIATDTKFRNKGFGLNLLEYGESELSNLFPDKDFVVFSRIESIPFYLKSNYDFKNEKEYDIVGIKHRLMIKTAPNNV